MDLDFIDADARKRYASRRQQDLQQCLESLKAKDFETLETIGHNLKGNGISFGYPELSRLGEELEISAKNTNFHKAQNCVHQFEEWISSHLKF